MPGNNAGSGYAVGDYFCVGSNCSTTGGTSEAVGRVLTLTGSAVATFVVVWRGSGYTTLNNQPTTKLSGSGSSLNVNVTACTTACTNTGPSGSLSFTNADYVDGNSTLNSVWAAVPLNSNSQVSASTLQNPLNVASGGTGATSLGSSNNVVLGNGSGALTASADAFPAAAPTNNHSSVGFSSIGVGSYYQAPQKAMLTSLFTTASTSLVNVTGLSFSVDANTSYVLTCELAYKSVASDGMSIAFTGPASPTLATYSVSYYTSATAANGASTTGNVFGTAIGGVTIVTANTDFPATISGGFTMGTNSGTLQLQVKNGAAVTLGIEAGSWCQLQ